jgi:hypothetical protein
VHVGWDKRDFMAVCLYDCGPFIYSRGHFISLWAFSTVGIFKYGYGRFVLI